MGIERNPGIPLGERWYRVQGPVVGNDRTGETADENPIIGP